MKLQKLTISKKDQIALPVFYNFIFKNNLIPSEIENKIFKYSEKTQKYVGRTKIEKPISKIVDLKKL